MNSVQKKPILIVQHKNPRQTKKKILLNYSKLDFAILQTELIATMSLTQPKVLDLFLTLFSNIISYYIQIEQKFGTTNKFKHKNGICNTRGKKVLTAEELSGIS